MINSDQLQSLSLEYNLLTSLTRNFLPVSVKLRKLKLAENPWTCDCRLLHLRELQVSTPSSQDPVCNLIPDLTCAPEISIEAISRPPGIQCKVSSWPRPWVKWSKDGVELESSSYVMESEDVGSMPRLVTSILTTSQPGLYSCHVGTVWKSLDISPDLASSQTTNNSNSLVLLVGVTVGALAMGLIIVLLFFLYLLRKTRSKLQGPSHSGSVTSLEYIRPMMRQTNPVPKPPRSYPHLSDSTKLLSTVSMEDPYPSLSRSSTFPPVYIPEQFSNTPRSRASIGTVSIASAFLNLQTSQSSYTPCLHPSGYMTLPRKPSFHLGPRTSGDGSSQASLDTSLERPGKLSHINTPGLPSVFLESQQEVRYLVSPVSQDRLLHTIKEQE